MPQATFYKCVIGANIHIQKIDKICKSKMRQGNNEIVVVEPDVPAFNRYEVEKAAIETRSGRRVCESCAAGDDDLRGMPDLFV